MCYVIGVKVPKKQTIQLGDTPLELDPIDKLVLRLKPKYVNACWQSQKVN
jgi:hypothetical protein